MDRGGPAASAVPPAAFAAARLALAPWAWITSPKFFGLGNVPADRPFLLVGNHTLFGLLDVPLMLLGLWEARGVSVRPLGDHLHFQVPGWRDLLRLFGTVDGTPDNCRALMRAGQSILVFPGGAREVFKHRGEKYCLLWGDRMGFARLAIEAGYPIVPFAAVGAEECFDIVLDASDAMRFFPPLRLLPRADELPPFVHGIGPSLLPRPERFYFHFGPAIETEHLRDLRDSVRMCVALREQVRAAVEAGIAYLQCERERDPRRALLTRIAHDLRSTLGARAAGA
jgi:1-acyl-sn-glycerol-3-phosphate acyltransferase